jgi:hypothetical protein
MYSLAFLCREGPEPPEAVSNLFLFFRGKPKKFCSGYELVPSVQEKVSATAESAP